jgi:hypothetical protein
MKDFAEMNAEYEKWFTHKAGADLRSGLSVAKGGAGGD